MCDGGSLRTVEREEREKRGRELSTKGREGTQSEEGGGGTAAF